MIYDVTDRLRMELETARQQYAHTKARSREAGLSTEQYVTLGKRAEYLRGRADGIRLALDVVANDMRCECAEETVARLRRLFA